VEGGLGSARPLGIELGNMLFGNLSDDAEQARSWVLVLDDALFGRSRSRGGRYACP
jgi:hypothetical protein